MSISTNKCSEIGVVTFKTQNPDKGPKGGMPACGVTGRLAA